METGIQEISIERNGSIVVRRSVSATYYALDMGGEFLIFKSSSGPSTTIEGELAALPKDLEKNLFNTAEMRAIRERFYPFYLDTSAFRTPGYWAIALVMGFAALLGWKALPVWRRLQDLDTHPVMARVMSWGDPIAESAQVERENGGADRRKSVTKRRI